MCFKKIVAPNSLIKAEFSNNFKIYSEIYYANKNVIWHTLRMAVASMHRPLIDVIKWYGLGNDNWVSISRN